MPLNENGKDFPEIRIILKFFLVILAGNVMKL